MFLNTNTHQLHTDMGALVQVRRNFEIGTNVDYDQFFHPDICHVCKAINQDDMEECERCGMVSYCSEEHKEYDRPQHIEFCMAVAQMLSEIPTWRLTPYDLEPWIAKQEEFLRYIQALLPRRLRPIEMQMFMFARNCLVCRRRHVAITCRKCFSVSFCIVHIMKVRLHMFDCREVAISLSLDIIFLEEAAWQPIHVKFSVFPDKKLSFKDMDSFCFRYRRRLAQHDRLEINHAAFTDYVSDPLTLFFGLRATRLFKHGGRMNTYVVHIIAANYVDRRNFGAWELFLHVFEKGKKLIIIMIGPELEYETCEHQICSRCKNAKKRLSLEVFPQFYHGYMCSTRYKPPNVIIGFQTELGHRHYFDDTWSDTIRAIRRQNCPLLLTAKSVDKIKMDMSRIRSVLSRSVRPIRKFRNKYCSERPYRDYETGSVLYRNRYLIIYKNLNASNDPTPGTSRDSA